MGFFKEERIRHHLATSGDQMLVLVKIALGARNKFGLRTGLKREDRIMEFGFNIDVCLVSRERESIAWCKHGLHVVDGILMTRDVGWPATIHDGHVDVFCGNRSDTILHFDRGGGGISPPQTIAQFLGSLLLAKIGSIGNTVHL